MNYILYRVIESQFFHARTKTNSQDVAGALFSLRMIHPQVDGTIWYDLEVTNESGAQILIRISGSSGGSYILIWANILIS